MSYKLLALAASVAMFLSAQSVESSGNGNGNGDSNKITICHIPPGNPGNAQTMMVNENAVAAHMAHGDSMGACPVAPPPPPPPCEHDCGGGNPPPPPPNNGDNGGGCTSNCGNNGEGSGDGTNSTQADSAPKVIGFTVDPNFILSSNKGEVVSWIVAFIYDDGTITEDSILPITTVVRPGSTARGAMNNCIANSCNTLSFVDGFVSIAVTVPSLNITKIVTVDIIPTALANSTLIIMPNANQVSPGSTATACVIMPRTFKSLGNTLTLTLEYGKRVRKTTTVILKRDIAEGEQFCFPKTEVTGLTEEGVETLNATLRLNSTIIANGVGQVWYKYGGVQSFLAAYHPKENDAAIFDNLYLLMPSAHPGVTWEEVGIMIGGKFYLPLSNVTLDGSGLLAEIIGVSRGYTSRLIPGYYDVVLIGRKIDGTHVTLIEPKALYVSTELTIE